MKVIRLDVYQDRFIQAFAAHCGVELPTWKERQRFLVSIARDPSLQQKVEAFTRESLDSPVMAARTELAVGALLLIGCAVFLPIGAYGAAAACGGVLCLAWLGGRTGIRHARGLLMLALILVATIVGFTGIGLFAANFTPIWHCTIFDLRSGPLYCIDPQHYRDWRDK